MWVITVDDAAITTMIARIAKERDPNRQHTMEYYLYKHFIRYVASTAPEPYQSLAIHILTTDTLGIGESGRKRRTVR